MKAIQKFTNEYLDQCKTFSPSEIVKYLDGFRALCAASKKESDRSKLISMRVEERLLGLFREKAEQEGVRYQTKLKDLMRSYVGGLQSQLGIER